MSGVEARTGAITEVTRAVVARFYRLAMAGDGQALLDECVHEDIVVEEPSYLPHAGIHRGSAAFAGEVLASAANLIELSSLRIEHILADGDRAAAIVHARVIDSDDDVIIAEHWVVADGKLSGLRVYVHDPAPLLARMRVLQLA